MLALYLEARRMMGWGPGRAGAPSLLLGAGRRAGAGSSTSSLIRPIRHCSSQNIAAGPRLLLVLEGAGPGPEGVFCVAETPLGPGGGF